MPVCSLIDSSSFTASRRNKGIIVCELIFPRYFSSNDFALERESLISFSICGSSRFEYKSERSHVTPSDPTKAVSIASAIAVSPFLFLFPPLPMPYLNGCIIFYTKWSSYGRSLTQLCFLYQVSEPDYLSPLQVAFFRLGVTAPSHEIAHQL